MPGPLRVFWTFAPLLSVATLVVVAKSASAGPVGSPLASAATFTLATTRAAFDDPTWHGAADSCPCWNVQAGRVFVYYTTRRAGLTTGKAVEWMFGSSIGIASTSDGFDWKYEGIARGDAQLSDAETDKITWWAPHVFRDGGTYHMYVTFVDGIYDDWTGKAFIKHFTSTDGLRWTYQDIVDTGDARCIDPCVMRINDRWWMWFKDPKPGATIWTASSSDLKTWKLEGSALTPQPPEGYEAPFVFEWRGDYWLIVDTTRNGCDVYKSKTAANGSWQPAGHLWGGHMGVMTVGDKRYLTRHRGLEKWEKPAVERAGQQTLLDIGELDIDERGELVQKW